MTVITGLNLYRFDNLPHITMPSSSDRGFINREAKVSKAPTVSSDLIGVRSWVRGLQNPNLIVQNFFFSQTNSETVLVASKNPYLKVQAENNIEIIENVAAVTINLPD